MECLIADREFWEKNWANKCDRLKAENVRLRDVVEANERAIESYGNDEAGIHKENSRLRDALRHYADRTMWRKEVIDSFSGECDFFDWDGDLADEPYEIADKALAAVADEHECDREAMCDICHPEDTEE